MAFDDTPILVGAGQVLQRDADPAEAMGPVDMMAEAARRASIDCGTGPAALENLNLVAVVDTLAWQAANPPRLVAEAIGARPARELASTVGGNTPQALVNAICADIRRGRCGLALIVGVNVLATLIAARKQSVELDWPTGGEGSPESFGDGREGTSAYENNHGLSLPAHVYPLFDNALRAHRGLDVATHSANIGAMFHEFSKVAAGNDYAWFPTVRTAKEIAEPSDSNRMVGFPYTKYMNAIIRVDQSAALLLTSVGRARQLGIDEGRWIYFLGGADANEAPWFMSERPSFVESPAMKLAGDQALSGAGATISDIDFVDFYSCFPSAVEVACESLNISETDPRGLTVTGGLPFFGGPGNNYSTHAIASMMERLREKPGAKGLVTANGWYLTKHAAGVYSSAPPSVTEAAPVETKTAIGAHEGGPVPLVAEAEGAATVETYTVLHERDGTPSSGIVIGRLIDGPRFIANTPEDRVLLEELTTTEGVGRTGKVENAGETNRFVPD